MGEDVRELPFKERKAFLATETTWFKILNPTYSQKEGRGELFEKRAG